MLPITVQYITKNFENRTIKPEYIVIHETGNRKEGANAQAHYKYWNTQDSAQASAHFLTDKDSILQVIRDNNVAWHCGVKYSSNVNVPECNNYNSIGIEICVNSDGDYMKARENAIDLTVYLMKKLNIPASKVIRHFDCCAKQCPETMILNPALWTDFKEKISAGSTSNNANTQNTNIDKSEQGKLIKVDVQGLNLREGPSTSSKVLRILKNEEVLVIIGKQQSWINVKYSNLVGWVAEEYTKSAVARVWILNGSYSYDKNANDEINRLKQSGKITKKEVV